MPELPNPLAEAGRLEQARRASQPRRPESARDADATVVVVVGRLNPVVESGITEAGFTLAASTDTRQVWVRATSFPPNRQGAP
jgi:hypothetical protein